MKYFEGSDPITFLLTRQYAVSTKNSGLHDQHFGACAVLPLRSIQNRPEFPLQCPPLLAALQLAASRAYTVCLKKETATINMT